MGTPIYLRLGRNIPVCGPARGIGRVSAFFQLGTGQTIQHAFEAAGFYDVSSDRFNVYLRYESDKEAIGAFLGSAVALAYRKFDEQTKEEAHAEYIESIQPYWNASAYEISSKFVIVAGRK